MQAREAILNEVEPVLLSHSHAVEEFHQKVSALLLSLETDGYFFYKQKLLTNQQLVDEFGVWLTMRLEPIEYFPVVRNGIELILDGEIERLERKTKTSTTQKSIEAIRSRMNKSTAEPAEQ